MTYSVNQSVHKPRKWPFYVLVIVGSLMLLALGGAVGARQYYYSNLKPVNTAAASKTVTIKAGTPLSQIAQQLKKEGLIRHENIFVFYVKLEGAAKYLQSGTYDLSASQSTQQIVAQLTHGKVSTQLVTVLPGQRLDQIRASLIKQGFSESEVDAALDPAAYESHPALAGKPKGNSLEGYLYPDSFQRTEGTKLSTIITQSLDQMKKHLTPDVQAGFASQGLNEYQGVILASIVEQEVTKQSDRAQAAQVFIKRVKMGMQLGSDVTAFYGSEIVGRGKDVAYDTPYNTRLHTGFPPTPISNVSSSSLMAVARPASTDWLFFVAGDDGVTYFSRTVQEHEALTRAHCIKLCQ